MKIAEQKDKNFNVKVFDSNYNKIKLLRQLEDDNGLKKFVFDDIIDDTKIIVINNFEVIKKVCRIDKKPMTYTELIKMRVTIYKQLIGSECIITNRIRKNGKERQGYQLNNKFILKNINLNSFTNNYYTNYDDDILKLLIKYC